MMMFNYMQNPLADLEDLIYENQVLVVSER